MSRTDTTWMADGACRGTPPDTFFPARGEDVAAVKALCATCTVRTDCLRYALDNHEEYGVWGGTSEAERRAIATGQPLPTRTSKPIVHGTNNGYHAHKRRGVPVCASCAEAHRTYVREQARQRRKAQVAA